MASPSAGQGGLFLGLITVDTIYLAAAPPAANQKCSADDFSVAAGGPATNAAVAFAHLGGEAVLAGAVGRHPLATLISTELSGLGVTLLDLMPDDVRPPPLSSIVVSRGTGERAVISRNSAGRTVADSPQLAGLIAAAGVLLADGHQMGLARQAVALKGDTPLVVDAGSWKPGFGEVIAGADYVIASADFRPPGCADEQQVFAWLRGQGVGHAAISHGAGEIRYVHPGGSGRLAVPEVNVVDTLGAGDFLHGAFCHFCLRQGFVDALASAAEVASLSCTVFGTRGWLLDTSSGRG